MCADCPDSLLQLSAPSFSRSARPIAQSSRRSLISLPTSSVSVITPLSLKSLLLMMQRTAMQSSMLRTYVGNLGAGTLCMLYDYSSACMLLLSPPSLLDSYRHLFPLYALHMTNMTSSILSMVTYSNDAINLALYPTVLSAKLCAPGYFGPKVTAFGLFTRKKRPVGAIHGSASGFTCCGSPDTFVCARVLQTLEGLDGRPLPLLKLRPSTHNQVAMGLSLLLTLWRSPR